MSFIPFNPDAEKQTFRRRLPHRRQGGRTYFVFFCLCDSLPAEKCREGKLAWLKIHGLAREEELSTLPRLHVREFRSRFDAVIQAMLDAGYGECWLANPVAEAVLHSDGDRYMLGLS